MTGLTLKEAQEIYRRYLDAERKVLSSQRYKIEDKELERASLSEIRDGIKYWMNMCKTLSPGGKRGIKGFRVIPTDL